MLDYQLYLFDFDGILVNTEQLHYKAYQLLCSTHGFSLGWDMATYVRHAMFSSDGLRRGIYTALPALEQKEPDWNVLYAEKKRIYTELLRSEGVSLMVGVEELLKGLQALHKKRCVVTHSPADHVALIREQNPLLDTIPNWITREHYSEPKPSSECYLKAIAKLADKQDRIIGFEDSPRGLKALLGTRAEGVFVSDIFKKEEIAESMPRDFAHIPSFNSRLS